MDEIVEKLFERIFNQKMKRQFIGDLVVEIWEHIEYYKTNGKPNNRAAEIAYDKMCATLFAHLSPYLDTKKIEERD